MDTALQTLDHRLTAALRARSGDSMETASISSKHSQARTLPGIRPGLLAMALVFGLMATVDSAARAEGPSAEARRAVASSECGPVGCPARRSNPWQHTAGFALAVGAAIWAAPRPHPRATVSGS